MLVQMQAEPISRAGTEGSKIMVSMSLPEAGHLLQSPAWAAFKAKHGWKSQTISTRMGTHSAYAQVLFRRVGPFSIGYVPRGPLMIDPDNALVERFAEELDQAARKHRALWVLVEPNDRIPTLPGFVASRDHIQPTRTVRVPLATDDEMLAAMHKKTRYHVRLATRHGITILAGGVQNVEAFYQLLQETSDRNGFCIHPISYYRDALIALGENAVLLCAEHEGNLVAAVIVAASKQEGIYLYGCSSTQHRGHGATSALQFAAMQWARERGCSHYDLWGIPERDPEVTQTDDGKHQRGSYGEDMTGLYRFKTGFGGEIVQMPATMEKVYHPWLARMVRQVISLRRKQA